MLAKCWKDFGDTWVADLLARLPDGTARDSTLAGVSCSDAVSASLASVMDGVDSVARNIGQITAAVEEQRKSVEHVAGRSGELARQSEENSAAERQIHGSLGRITASSKSLEDSMLAFQA